jgi:hypothetical protein
MKTAGGKIANLFDSARRSVTQNHTSPLFRFILKYQSLLCYRSTGNCYIWDNH